MLAVATFKVSDPISLVVLVEGDDPAVQLELL
jgi:hypothetical protein